MMNSGYKPYFDPEIESLIERMNPPRVCIDNETCKDCSLVKVDSANRHGILLEMVQVLTDLDLIISKSYICSDGGWFMDVFHVTDQHGNQITDKHLIHYIEQALCVGKKGAKAKEVQTHLGDVGGPIHIQIDRFNAMEMTVTDRPGLLSEVSAVLVELGFHVVSAAAWTHNSRAACIMYFEDESRRGPITDLHRLADAEEQLESLVGAHHFMGERRGVRLSAPEVGRMHTERRLHQLMYADRDYDLCFCDDGEADGQKKCSSSCSNCCGAQVSIETCNERGYSVVNVTSRDRPKLLFDTVCTLTDMKYVVFHAAISSQGSLAVQEYYIRHMDGCILDTEGEKERVIKCLEASIERRVSHGLRLDLCTQNRVGLLSDITRVFREHGMSLSRADLGTRGDQAIGSFYVADSSGNAVDSKTVELVRNEIGETILKVNKSSVWDTLRYSSSSARNIETNTARSSSLGGLLWAQLERLSSNFGPIRS
ncbi:Act domain-containing protein acr3 [Thalictrum thalictroides]|uniref:ACT domain-containing protein ACR n=1 Tax=Thalictrum thalictroides TaxID=46969 RepID=A0A7J6V9U8_THATH|nr:Act domain-containing protein acr3 [Thalictrum thalictroides]